MNRLKQILRLKEAGTSIQAIAKTTGASRNTVKKYLRIIDDKKLPVQELLEKDVYELETIITDTSEASDHRNEEMESFIPYMQEELKRTGVNRWYLWGEYKSKYPNGFSYSHFCYYYRNWQKSSQATLHIEQQAGDKLYIDYTGKKLQIVDKSSGEIQDVEVYLCCLGHSQLTYVEATLSQGKEDFIYATQNALQYYQGVPKALVPDNLKSAVSKSCKYEPKINDDFLDFANHYGTAVLPARSYKPRDKAIVEKTVSIIYSRIFAPLRNKNFYSLKELNQAILELLEEHNKQILQGKDYSRKDYFERHEKHLLKPLPQDLYELKNYVSVKVMKNCHIRLFEDIHYYSVPYKYIGEQVKVEYTSKHVSIYHKNQRIAFHIRNGKKYGYSTEKEHMPSSHQFISEWNPDKFITWASKIDDSVKDYLQVILDSKRYPEQAYRSCVGILTLEKKQGKQRLIAACKRAAYYNNYGYGVILNILKKNLDKISVDTENPKLPTLPDHKNIRGSELYK